MVTESEEPKRGQETVAAPEIVYHDLPDSAYDMWVRGDLPEQMGYPPETRIEVIEGAIFVVPPPAFLHGLPIQDIQDALVSARLLDPEFRWRSAQNLGFNLLGSPNGYIPDLVVLDVDAYRELGRDDAAEAHPDQVAMVVEVTSKSNAVNDRAPSFQNPMFSKWRACARAGVPYYLLVDRDPKFAAVTLFGEPANGRYTPLAAWTFGEPFTLPSPFNVAIDATEWKPWSA
jgi:Uma2 family endonuclease